MQSTTQQAVSQPQRRPSTDVVLQVLIPPALKARLRQIQYEREQAAEDKSSYRDLVIEALENTYPEEPKKKRAS